MRSWRLAADRTGRADTRESGWLCGSEGRGARARSEGGARLHESGNEDQTRAVASGRDGEKSLTPS